MPRAMLRRKNLGEECKFMAFRGVLEHNYNCITPPQMEYVRRRQIRPRH